MRSGLSTADAGRIAEAAYAKQPRILNDPRQSDSAWQVDVMLPAGRVRSSRGCVELRPRLSPNPRLAYQTATYYAGAHPPLAASMVRMAGKLSALQRPSGQGAAAESCGPVVVWDPFCGTAMELIESALFNGNDCSRLGGLSLVGTDLDEAALAVAQTNVEAAKSSSSDALRATHASFHEIDFREASKLTELPRGGVSLIITNPPLGQRVKWREEPHSLFASLFALASELLHPGGKLVFINPLRVAPRDGVATLRLDARSTVDLGLRRGCSVEVWRKLG